MNVYFPSADYEMNEKINGCGRRYIERTVCIEIVRMTYTHLWKERARSTAITEHVMHFKNSELISRRYKLSLKLLGLS